MLVELRCKVGDQVFVVYGYEIQHTGVYSMKIESEDDHFVFIIKCMVSQGGTRFEKFIFGKTAFLTREEAEIALDSRRKEDRNVAFMTTARKTADSIYNADYRKQSEVAKEIFDEVERILSLNYCCCLPQGATEHYEYYEGDVAKDIAELKKKYTSVR